MSSIITNISSIAIKVLDSGYELTVTQSSANENYGFDELPELIQSIDNIMKSEIQTLNPNQTLTLNLTIGS